MVQRYEPCHKYFDQWDEDGYSSCRPAKDGEYVRYTTFMDEYARLNAQIERLKTQLRKVEEPEVVNIFE
jgi:hypothetical protein